MLEQLNIGIFNLINQFAGHNAFLDNTMIILAKYLPFLFVLFLIYLWFIRDDYKKVALLAGYSAILGILSDFLITSFYFHPRPFMDRLGTLLINHAPETSFPSDHTTLMLSIAFMLLYLKETRKAGLVLSIFGILGGISRIFCGLHYPFDIVGSLFVAIISSSFIYLLKDGLGPLNNLIVSLYRKIFQKAVKKFNKQKIKRTPPQ